MFPTQKENPRIYNLLSILFILIIGFFAVQIWKSLKEAGEVGLEPKQPNLITIEGEGKVSGAPDLARVDIGLVSEGADVQKVQAQNSTKINAMVRALRELGIQEVDIQTLNYGVSPKYRYNEGRQTIDGYIVSQNLAVKVRDLSRIGTVLARLGELGANQVNGVTFTVDEPTALQAQARQQAIDDAKNKATDLSRALGVKIVRLVNFSESLGGLPLAPNAFKSQEEAMNFVAPEIQPGTLDIASRVTMTFEIR